MPPTNDSSSHIIIAYTPSEVWMCGFSDTQADILAPLPGWK